MGSRHIKTFFNVFRCKASWLAWCVAAPTMWAMPGYTANVTGCYQAGKQRSLLAACRQHTQLCAKLMIENGTRRLIYVIRCYGLFDIDPLVSTLASTAYSTVPTSSAAAATCSEASNPACGVALRASNHATSAGPAIWPRP